MLQLPTCWEKKEPCSYLWSPWGLSRAPHTDLGSHSAIAESASYSHMACGHSQTHNTQHKTTQGYPGHTQGAILTAPQSHPVSIVVAG